MRGDYEKMSEELQIRVYREASQPTLIYLPGLHGDWTLIGGFRQALAGRVRFVEVTYPRTLTWSLDDYAAAVESALAAHGINRGWLLGESFGSQVVWAMVGRKRFGLDGVILAGGFVKHPAQLGMRLAQWTAGHIPMAVVTRILFSYARIARFRYRRSPEVLSGIDEFIARRTQLDRQAATHRLGLVGQSEFSLVARQIEAPVYALTGLVDPVVPWPWVRHWLKRNCPRLREYRIIHRADHNVLGTAPEAAAEQVVKWITQSALRH